MAKTEEKGNWVSARQARRLLLKGAGLLDDPERRIGPKSLYRQIERMGFVQVDTISVAVRAHHHILLTRFDGYRPEILKRLREKERFLFEHWTHDASIIPSTWLRFWTPRFHRYQRLDPAHRWWRDRLGEEAERIVESVRERIVREGPLMSRDFEKEPRPDLDQWWGWKPHKAALEHLWRCGDLSVAARVNFQKVYDLTERVFPSFDRRDIPDRREHLDWACNEALQRLGVATPGELAGFFDAVTAEEAKEWCRRAVEAGQAQEVIVESADDSPPRKALARTDWKRQLRRSPPPPGRIRLLSPFDPAIRDRKRLQRLFAFDYRLEAFVPKPKRRYGYYVLPILEGDRLLGRLDPKYHSDRTELEVKALWWEPGVEIDSGRKRSLEEAVERLAAFLGAQRIRMP